MRSRKGSALVWLAFLFVAGIFGAMMMMEGYSLPAPSKALAILRDMRNVKTALLTWYAFNADSLDQNGRINGQTIEEFIDTPEGGRQITSFLPDNIHVVIRGASAQAGDFRASCGDEGRSWFIGYWLDEKVNMQEQGRLAGQAQKLKLTDSTDADSPLYSGGNSRWLWMQILGE